MRSFLKILILNLLLFSLNRTALISQQTSNPPQQIQNSKPTPEMVVVDCVAERLGMLPKDVRLDLSIAEQPKPGDDFDFIEIIASIEETLNIEISDDMLAGVAGVSNGSDLTNDLTIKQLQSAVKKLVVR